MSNKTYWIILIGALITIMSLVAAFTDVVPVFLAPFVAVIIGISILFMAR